MTTEIVQSQSAGLISVIERAASDPNIDVNKMMQLLDMQERIMKKNAEIAFNNAKTRLKFPTIAHTSEIRHNGKLVSRYTKYEDMDKIVRPIYEAEGFSISFNTRNIDGKTVIYGKLSHVDGHFEEAEMQLPLDAGGAKNAVQAVASTLTYGKRYLVQMLLNIVTGGEDDDGAGSAQVLSHERAVEIDLLIGKVGADKEKFLAFMGAESVQGIREGDYDKAINALKAKGAKK